MPNPIDIYDDKGKKIGEAREREWGYKGDYSGRGSGSSGGSSGGGGNGSSMSDGTATLLAILCILGIIAAIFVFVVLPLWALVLWTNGNSAPIIAILKVLWFIIRVPWWVFIKIPWIIIVWVFAHIKLLFIVFLSILLLLSIIVARKSK
ncbi:MAG: hypothetical protein AAB740_03080 [Patescibacteria group bacterium]